VAPEARSVGLLAAVEEPRAPARREVVAGLPPRPPAADVPRLRDVPELGAERLSIVGVAVQRQPARCDASARLESPRGEVVATGARPGRVDPVRVAHRVAAPRQARRL